MLGLLVTMLFPLSLVAATLLAGLLLRFVLKREKPAAICFVTATAVLVLGGTYPLPTMLLSRLESRYPPLGEGVNLQAQIAAMEYVVVLGGSSVDNPDLPITSRHFPAQFARVIEGMRIHRSLEGATLVLSGGSAGPVSEAEMMARLLASLGVDRSGFILDARSGNTYEQALEIKGIVGKSRFVLVTSAAHMPRAMALFKKAGMDPLAAPADHMVKSGAPTGLAKFLPHTDYLRRLDVVLYEYLGMLKAVALGRA